MPNFVASSSSQLHTLGGSRGPAEEAGYDKPIFTKKRTPKQAIMQQVCGRRIADART